jgi:hypothetical protein
MLEVTVADPSLDPFALSKRPFRIENCNNPPPFTPAVTRVPTPSVFFESRRATYESTFSTQIGDPLPLDAPISSSDSSTFTTDHFHRSFMPFSLPQPVGRPVPVLPPDSDLPPKPHWFCDLPQSNMRLAPKIYLPEANTPIFTHPLPICCSCGDQLTYPFMASLSHDICLTCIAAGHLPPQTTTLDFFTVDAPE